MEIKSIRPALSFGLFVCVVVIGVALSFHYYLELKACSLCIVETALFALLSVILFLAILHNPKTWGRRIYGLLLTLISITGALVAGRHAWLEQLPKDGTPQCEPQLETWINDLPAPEAIQKLLNITDGCTEISFSFLSLSVPELITIIFSLFLIYSLRLLLIAR